MPDYAVDLIELMDHLQLDRAHVIGLSLGGVIAQRLAIDHPSRVDRLVLISCTNRFGPYLREMAKMIGQAMRYFPRGVFHRTVNLLATSPDYLDNHPLELEREAVQAEKQNIPRKSLIRELRCLGSEDLTKDGCYRITAPTLVIAGEQDAMIAPCYDRAMAREIPGSTFKLLAGCGHNPLEEQPEIVASLIRDFLMRPKHRLGKEKELVEQTT